jgi:DNA modification methylase
LESKVNFFYQDDNLWYTSAVFEVFYFMPPKNKITTITNKNGLKCQVVLGDSREILAKYENRVDLIITSPPYADARHKHYDSVHPDLFAEWFMTFHQPFFNALKPEGSLIINIKDKVVDGVRHRYVWHSIEALSKAGWYCIDDYIWHKPN